MLFHVFSDLHLEHHPDINSFKTFINKFPYIIYNIDINSLSDKILILAGDIGYPTSSNYFEFLKDCCSVYKYVIFTTGNHEYYNSEINFINDLLEKESSKISNLHFLLNKSVITHIRKYF